MFFVWRIKKVDVFRGYRKRPVAWNGLIDNTFLVSHILSFMGDVAFKALLLYSCCTFYRWRLVLLSPKHQKEQRKCFHMLYCLNNKNYIFWLFCWWQINIDCLILHLKTEDYLKFYYLISFLCCKESETGSAGDIFAGLWNEWQKSRRGALQLYWKETLTGLSLSMFFSAKIFGIAFLCKTSKWLI